MQLTQTSIPDVLILEPKVHEDQRGFFMETYQKQRYVKAGLPESFVQDNHTRSKQGTLRGLHYQIQQTQGKLVRAVIGEIFDVAVDIRCNSPTFKQWVGTVLSAENKKQLWVPPGFAHGFYVLSEWAEVVYKVTDYYAPQWDRVLVWNDPEIGIEWPLLKEQPPFLSERDANGKSLKEAELFA